MTRRLALAAMTAALWMLAACVTINVYFPAAAVKDLSRQIEKQVQEQAAAQALDQAGDGTAQPAPPPGSSDKQLSNLLEPPPGARPGEGDARRIGMLDSLMGVTPAYAQSEVPAPEISNPAIRKIIDARAARLAQVNDYKSRGVVGENNQALLEIRNLEAVADLKARAELQRLVKAENADREELFREIAAAKKVDPSQLPKIRETYASTLREGARPKDWIQMPDGTWKQK